MLLVMHRLPSHIKYSDIKILIKNKCYIEDIILDKLQKDSETTKQVTIGVAGEEDGMRILHRLNGTYIEGQQIFIKEVKGSSSSKSDTSYKNYQTPANLPDKQPQGYPVPNPKVWNTPIGVYQGGTVPDQNFGYQNQQMMQNYGYNAMGMYGMPNTPAVPSLMQTNFMAYGSQQGQAQQFSHPTQGQSGAGGAVAQASNTTKELGFGYTPRPCEELGFRSNQKDTVRQSYTNKDNGLGSQARKESHRENRFDSDNYDQGKRFGSGNARDETRRHEDRSRMGGNQNRFDQRDKSYGQKITDDRIGSRNSQEDSRSFRNQTSSGRNDRGSESQDPWRNREREYSREESGRDRSRDRNADRKRRYSPETDSRDNGGRFQSNRSYEDNHRGFGDNPRGQDSRDYRGNSCWDSNPVKPAPKPFEQRGKPNNAFFWSKNNPPSQSDRSNFSNNSSFNKGPPSSHKPASPSATTQGPVKRAKIEKKNSHYEEIRKRANQAISWRCQAVSALVNGILDRFKTAEDSERFGKNNYLPCVKSLKAAINNQLDELMQKKYPRSVHPVLQEKEIVELYRSRYPESGDIKIYKANFDKLGKAPAPTQDKKPVDVKPKIQMMNPPASTKVPQAKLSVPKPKPLFAGPKPLVPGPKPQIPSPKPQIPGPKFQIPSPKPQIPGPKFQIPSPKPQIPGPKFQISGPQPQISGLKPQVPSPKPPVAGTFRKPTLADLLSPQLWQANKMPIKNYQMTKARPPKKPKVVDVAKRQKADRRQLHKREFLEDDLYKCQTPIMEKALNAVMDEISDVFKTAVEEYPTTDEQEKIIGRSILNKAGPEFRSIVRLHTIKRILNETSTLLLRFFIKEGKSSKMQVERALIPYGVTYLKACTRTKTKMFMGCADSYASFDRLCASPGIPAEGRFGTSLITAKPLHLIIPFKYRRLLRNKQYFDLTGDLDDDNVAGFGDDKDDDDDDDDDEIGDELVGDDGDELAGDDGDELTGDNGDKLPGDDGDGLTGDGKIGDGEELPRGKLPGDEDDDVIEVIKEIETIECGDVTLITLDDDDGDADIKGEASDSAATKQNTIDTTDIDYIDDDEMGDCGLEIDEAAITEDDLEDY